MILHCAHPDRRRGINARDRNHRRRIFPGSSHPRTKRVKDARVAHASSSPSPSNARSRARRATADAPADWSPRFATRIDRLGLISRCPKGQHRRRVTVARQVRLTRFSRRTFRTIILFIVPVVRAFGIPSRRLARGTPCPRARSLARISISSPRSFERGVRSV